MPAIFAVEPTDLSAFRIAGQPAGALMYTMSGLDEIACAAADEKSAAFGATGIVLTSTPSDLYTFAMTPRPVNLPCESSV